VEVLGRDFKARFAERFAGRLYSATLTRITTGAVDPTDAAGAPATTTVVYLCEGAAFHFDSSYIDGEFVKSTDFRVMLLLGSFELVADDAVKASLNLATVTDVVDTIVRARATGIGGNSITIEFVGDASFGAGDRVEVGTNVKIRFQPGVSTVADIEALIDGSALIEIDTVGTGATILSILDVVSSTPLANGVDGTKTPADSVVPQPGDTISIPPPGQTVARDAIVEKIETITNAAVTFRAAGLVF
jgi:hypothetical protein